MKRILVTGAGGAAAENFVRSIRENPAFENIYIVGTDTSKYHIELSSVDKKYLLPRVDDNTYLDKLLEIVKTENIDYVHPQPDVEVSFISKNRKFLPHELWLSNDEIVELCQNKMAFNKKLSDANIAVPDSDSFKNLGELEIVVNKMLNRHPKLWMRAIKGAGAKASLPFVNFSQANMWVKYWEEMKGLRCDDFMISEFLPGREYAFQSLWKDGELVMSQARERCEYIFGYLTVSGQTSSPSVARTINSDEINDLCERAIKIIDPNATGIFCVDLKTDLNNKIKITEINIGRFFTTSYFFSKAGINMPYYYLKLALGEPIPANIKKFNNLPENIYWTRMIDMGFKLIKNEEWNSIRI